MALLVALAASDMVVWWVRRGMYRVRAVGLTRNAGAGHIAYRDSL